MKKTKQKTWTNERAWIVGTILCPFLFAGTLALAVEVQGPCEHWTYDGECGPDRWCYHFPDACGREQSPINIVTEYVKDCGLPGPVFDYGPSFLSTFNNGHTVQVDVLCQLYVSHNGIIAGGKRYRLLQFHFHTASEHTVDGLEYPMEMHLVHQAQDGALAVVAVFIEAGKSHQLLSKVWQELPTYEDHASDLVITAKISSLLPENHTAFSYAGSLTTPPASEGVLWYVMVDPITMDAQEIERFRNIFSGNHFPNGNRRPVQPLYYRTVCLVSDTSSDTKPPGPIYGPPDGSTYPLLIIRDTFAVLKGGVVEDGGVPCEYRFKYWEAGGTPLYTDWEEDNGDVLEWYVAHERVLNLEPDTTYYYVFQLRNEFGADLEGSIREFTTLPLSAP